MTVVGSVVLSLVLSLPMHGASDLRLTGTLYRLNTNRQVKLYTWELVACPNAWTSRYFNLDGSVAVEDRVEFDGARLAGYSYVRHAIEERSSVRVDGKRLDFTYQRNGTSKARTRTTDGVFLAGPAVFSFIEAHLEQLQDGKKLEFKYGVLDVLDYFSFEVSSESRPDSESIGVEIRPTSLLVRLAVAPIHVTLSKEGAFRGVTGRTIVMEADGDRLIPIDADLVVESESPADCGTGEP